MRDEELGYCDIVSFRQEDIRVRSCVARFAAGAGLDRRGRAIRQVSEARGHDELLRLRRDEAGAEPPDRAPALVRYSIVWRGRGQRACSQSEEKSPGGVHGPLSGK